MDKWICINITYRSASLEYKGNKCSVFKQAGSIANVFRSLVETTTVTPEITDILMAMLNHRCVRVYEDSLVSPFFGQNTKRINMVYPSKVIIPYKADVSPRKEELNAVGKRLVTAECSFISDIKMTITIAGVQSEDIPELLKMHPSWFVGDIGLASPHAEPQTSKGA
ncbi:MAG: matrix protein [Pastinaca cytorhabdovirus 1]|uniref:Matrix protein n=1 Tax=Pastinaca cytorhabdovirus 1 TaxID=2950847 RepID=A0AAE9MSG8_9RHAB|nr:MAG: matrix protein [Pastinaca cytorhabdovirus 1]